MGGRLVQKLIQALVAMVLISPSASNASCLMTSLRSILPENSRTWSTYANVQRDARAFNTFRNAQIPDAIQRAVASGRLKVVRVVRHNADDGPGYRYEALPATLNPVPGRYYALVRLPDNQGLAISEFSSTNGVHIQLANSLRLQGRNSSHPDGQAIGGVLFFDDGARVSGRAQKISSQTNANELARELERMGIPVRERTPHTIRELNSPADRDWSGTATINMGP